MSVLYGLQPEKVFYYFEEISNIPRGSGNEKAVAEYCVELGKKLGLEAYSDKWSNVVIKKPGTAGLDGKDSVILQAHLDMVCEKNAGVVHDFLKDPLKLYMEGDNIKAEGTTLGADNGIAVAMILALLDDNAAIHPPLECLLTSEEEVGLKGAINFDYSRLSGKYLINLDTEEFGKAVVSCAGGLRTDTELVINRVNTSILNPKTLAVRIRGLKGGHSGADIHLERANANKLIGRLLFFLCGKIDYEICSISGGAKDNAIPREAQAYINISAENECRLKELLSVFESTVADEYKTQETGISVKCSVEEHISEVFGADTARKAIGIIMACPNGVLAMSFDIADLVETSNNLGIIITKENEIVFTCATRSSVDSRMDYVEAVIKNIAALAEASVHSTSRYPGWQFDNESKLRKLAAHTFKELTGKALILEAVHSGLECGILKENLPEADIISIGPDMQNVHTPDESLSVSGVGKTYEFLLKLLAVI